MARAALGSRLRRRASASRAGSAAQRASPPLKTGARVMITAGMPLKAMLDATPRESPIITREQRRAPVDGGWIPSVILKARDNAGISDVAFNDLCRTTARLA